MTGDAPPADDNPDRLANAVEEERNQEKAAAPEQQRLDEVTIDDPLFEVKDGIFKNKEMVHVGWVPDGPRIVGRQDYIDQISQYLNDAVIGEQPTHVAITGKTGTGKSLVSRFVAKRAQNAAIDGVRLGTVYLDCSEVSTVTQILSAVGQELNRDEFYEGEDTEAVVMPDAGLSKGKFYERFWAILDNYDSAILILDEVDMLESDVVLKNLAKAIEKKSTGCNIGIVAISNIIGYFDDLNPRTKSVFQPEDMLFDPYESPHLRRILEGRRDAFHDGVLEDGVIPLVAGMSAREHGDARKAMRLFRNAGEVADAMDAEQVKEEHVRDAQTKLEEDRFEEFLDGTTTQMKTTCLAIAAHSRWSKETRVLTGELYEIYTAIASVIELDPVTIRRFRDILGEMGLHHIIETREKNFGQRGGKHKSHRLLHAPEVVYDITRRDTRFEKISDDTLRDIVQAQSRANA